MGVAYKSPCVRYLSRAETGIARVQPETLAPDFNDVFSFNGVPPLVLIVVQMARRAALLPVRMLHDKETTAAVLRRDLEIGRADTEGAVFAKSVLATGNARSPCLRCRLDRLAD